MPKATHPKRTPLKSAHPAWRSATCLLAAAALLGGCATQPAAPPPPASTGAAGGGTAVGADATLQTCTEPVGTVRLQDGNAPAATTASTEQAQNATIQSMRLLLQDLSKLNPRGNAATPGQGFSIESLRLLIQQSNCLVIVDRGAAEGASADEKARTRNSGEVRDGANMGRGQEVAADFVLRSMVLSMNEEKSGINVAGFIPFAAAAGVRTGTTTKIANVQLVLSDVRANLQLAVAQGMGSGANTGLAIGVLGGGAGGIGGGGFSNEKKTQDSTVLLQAFADAYNKLVPALRNYKSQTVRGGLGAGGTLGVQGARPDASAVPRP